MPDIDAQEFILALPENSIIKAGLLSIGTSADAMQPTDELFKVIKAYEEVQVEYNAGTLPDIITVLPSTVLALQNVEDGIDRTIRCQLQFKEHYSVNAVEPVITI